MKTMGELSCELRDNRLAAGVGSLLTGVAFYLIYTDFSIADLRQPDELFHYLWDTLRLILTISIGLFTLYILLFPRKFCVGVSEVGITIRVWRGSKILRWEGLDKINIYEREGEPVPKIIVKRSGKRSFEIFCKEKDVSLKTMIQQRQPATQNTEVITLPSGIVDWTKENWARLIAVIIGFFMVNFLLL